MFYNIIMGILSVLALVIFGAFGHFALGFDITDPGTQQIFLIFFGLLAAVIVFQMFVPEKVRYVLISITLISFIGSIFYIAS